MLTLNRIVILNSLIKHETLKLTDLAKEENLGLTPDKQHLRFLLNELDEEGYIQKLAGAEACTYTITEEGIAEGRRLNEE